MSENVNGRKRYFNNVDIDLTVMVRKCDTLKSSACQTFSDYRHVFKDYLLELYLPHSIRLSLTVPLQIHHQRRLQHPHLLNHTLHHQRRLQHPHLLNHTVRHLHLNPLLLNHTVRHQRRLQRPHLNQLFIHPSRHVLRCSVLYAMYLNPLLLNHTVHHQRRLQRPHLNPLLLNHPSQHVLQCSVTYVHHTYLREQNETLQSSPMEQFSNQRRSHDRNFSTKCCGNVMRNYEIRCPSVVPSMNYEPKIS